MGFCKNPNNKLCKIGGNMFKITKEKLGIIIKRELEDTKYLKNIKNIDEYLINQAEKESSFFIYSTRYESHLNDMSVGLFQMLTKTMEDVGFDGNIISSFEVITQVKYALKYLDLLYSKFPEIKNKTERLKMAFSSYNCGRGNVNKALKKGRMEEEINYEGENTLQGKWSTYDNVSKMLDRYNIIGNRNVDINKRYIEFIIKKGEL